MGQNDRAKLLLQRRDPGDIARLLRYHTYFTRKQRERIVTLERSLLRLNETEQVIASGRCCEIQQRVATNQIAAAGQFTSIGTIKHHRRMQSRVDTAGVAVDQNSLARFQRKLIVVDGVGVHTP